MTDIGILEVQKLFDTARPLFADREPEITRAVLVTLCAVWFASFTEPERRRAAMAEWSDVILDEAVRIGGLYQSFQRSRH